MLYEIIVNYTYIMYFNNLIYNKNGGGINILNT